MFDILVIGVHTSVKKGKTGNLNICCNIYIWENINWTNVIAESSPGVLNYGPFYQKKRHAIWRVQCIHLKKMVYFGVSVFT